MLFAARSYFENLSTWLVLLKYSGLGLAAGSSIWATINILTVTAPDGRKELTGAGVVAIVFTILGLIVSIVSDDLQRRNAAATQKRQLQVEAKRTNEIIISGQPITSLSLRWNLRALGQSLSQLLQKSYDEALAFIGEQQGEQSGDQNNLVFRVYGLYPFLVALPRQFVKDSKPSDNPNEKWFRRLAPDCNRTRPTMSCSGPTNHVDG